MSNRTIEEMLNLTDSEESMSSDSGLFDTNQHLILELHDIKKDVPQKHQNETPDARIKKRKKKRAPPAVDKSATSTGSEQSDSATGEDEKEKFYDATASLLELPANPVKPTGNLSIAQAHSEHGQDPKIMQPTVPTSLSGSQVAQREATAVNKPLAAPDK
ncbi:unnamed protein product [Leptidea sinapis]|uniref:Uncharacterized protein n=1 Tax=Leptidea sinapis TaxID=189913 RepID=A0A5E4QQF5_9NEOP|nr:unnamed protein product [Leptidea sinapis]